MAAASEFIAQFFDATTLPICIAALANNRAEASKFPPREIYTRNPKKIDKFVSDYDVSGRAVYFCVTPIKSGKRRNKSNVDELHCLHADIDFKDVVETPAEIERVIRALPLPPRWVVLSGHGMHLYWLLQQVFRATAALKQRIESALKRLAWALAGDPAVCEVARLMRVPGSHNSKGGDKLLVQTLLETKVEYELEAVETWLGSVQEPLLHIKGPAVLPPKGNGSSSTASPFTAYGEQYAHSEQLDIAAVLDTIRYPGNVHDTERDVVASLISRGEPVDNIVAYLVQQLQARIPESGSWNWAAEIKELRYLCVTWFEKHPELLDKQEIKPDWLRNHSKIRPLLAGMANVIELQTVKQEKKDEQPAPELAFLFAEDLERRSCKELEWIAKDLVLARALNGVFGDGGVGKDLLLLQLAIAMTCEVPWIGVPVKAGKVLYFPVEDDLDELRRRQDRINSSYGIKASAYPQRFKIVPMLGKDTILGVFDSKLGVVRPTKLFEAVRRMIGEFQPELVIVGNRVNIFGVGQNDDAQARQCISLLNSLCVDFGTAVIMPSHVSQTGKSTGEGTSGSVQWNNGIRLRVYLRRVIDEDRNEKNVNVRELEVMKSNYSAKGEIKSLLWDLGIFKSTVGVGGVIETLKVQAGESEDEAKIRYAKQLLLDDQHEFLRMLDKYTAMGDRLSSAVTARNNAATIFSRDSDCNLNGENGYRKLRAAMERLFASGHIQTIEEGSLSKRVRFIKKVGLQVVKTDTTMVSDPQ